MADLFTHLVAARAPGVLMRDRHLVALLVIGTFLPDLGSKGLYWVLQAGDAYSVATHSLAGVLLISYLASLFVEEPLRRPGFVALLAGGLIHLAVDMAKANLGTGAVFPLLPFSDAAVEWGWIDSENVIFLVPIDALLLAAILLYERSRDRVRQ
jgi:hypothetical protein